MLHEKNKKLSVVWENLPALSELGLENLGMASSIYSMTVKTLPGDAEKIDLIQGLIERHVEIDRLLGKL